MVPSPFNQNSIFKTIYRHRIVARDDWPVVAGHEAWWLVIVIEECRENAFVLCCVKIAVDNDLLTRQLGNYSCDYGSVVGLDVRIT